MKQTLKILNSSMFIFFICFIACKLLNFNSLNTPILLLVLCIFPLIMVPYILDKIKLYHMNEILIFIYYLFLIISLILGSILGFYHKIWWFDLFSHFISGFLTSMIAYIILDKNKLVNKNNRWFNFIFTIIFTIAIAAIWEYLEFTIDLFGLNTQHSIETGVNDTMEDMLIATLGGIISSIVYLFNSKKRI